MVQPGTGTGSSHPPIRYAVKQARLSQHSICGRLWQLLFFAKSQVSRRTGAGAVTWWRLSEQLQEGVCVPQPMAGLLRVFRSSSAPNAFGSSRISPTCHLLKRERKKKKKKKRKKKKRHLYLQHLYLDRSVVLPCRMHDAPIAHALRSLDSIRSRFFFFLHPTTYFGLGLEEGPLLESFGTCILSPV